MIRVSCPVPSACRPVLYHSCGCLSRWLCHCVVPLFWGWRTDGWLDGSHCVVLRVLCSSGHRFSSRSVWSVHKLRCTSCRIVCAVTLMCAQVRCYDVCHCRGSVPYVRGGRSDGVVVRSGPLSCILAAWLVDVMCPFPQSIVCVCRCLCVFAVCGSVRTIHRGI